MYKNQTLASKNSLEQSNRTYSGENTQVVNNKQQLRRIASKTSREQSNRAYSGEKYINRLQQTTTP